MALIITGEAVLMILMLVPPLIKRRKPVLWSSPFYMPGAGHLGHSYWRTNWGQNYLSQVSEETGGESYYIGFGAPVAFSPYLEDLGRKLERQYFLTFLAQPEKKAGFQQTTLRTEVPNVDLVGADRVYVPAAQ